MSKCLLRVIEGGTLLVRYALWPFFTKVRVVLAVMSTAAKHYISGTSVLGI